MSSIFTFDFTLCAELHIPEFFFFLPSFSRSMEYYHNVSMVNCFRSTAGSFLNAFNAKFLVKV